MNEACEIAQIDSHIPHDVRHVMGWHLINKTGNIAAVQRQLGHTNATYSIQYPRIPDKEPENALDDWRPQFYCFHRKFDPLRSPTFNDLKAVNIKVSGFYTSISSQSFPPEATNIQEYTYTAIPIKMNTFYCMVALL